MTSSQNVPSRKRRNHGVGWRTTHYNLVSDRLTKSKWSPTHCLVRSACPVPTYFVCKCSSWLCRVSRTAIPLTRTNNRFSSEIEQQRSFASVTNIYFVLSIDHDPTKRTVEEESTTRSRSGRDLPCSSFDHTLTLMLYSLGQESNPITDQTQSRGEERSFCTKEPTLFITNCSQISSIGHSNPPAIIVRKQGKGSEQGISFYSSHRPLPNPLATVDTARICVFTKDPHEKYRKLIHSNVSDQITVGDRVAPHSL